MLIYHKKAQCLRSKAQLNKPLLYDQISFDKFHVSNVFWSCKLGIFDKFVEKILICTVKKTFDL